MRAAGFEHDCMCRATNTAIQELIMAMKKLVDMCVRSAWSRIICKPTRVTGNDSISAMTKFNWRVALTSV